MSWREIEWGLYRFHFWVSLLGAVVLILARLWRIDRFSTLYEYFEKENEQNIQVHGTSQT